MTKWVMIGKCTLTVCLWDATAFTRVTVLRPRLMKHFINALLRADNCSHCLSHSPTYHNVLSATANATFCNVDGELVTDTFL
ncbi:hypothetical protein FB567DRAFT_308859 [Paraphoma chrysanthemicola]|uniref:Secreted protein n=1 Tax=Paraphoma chrysanthemicola TaxID=798071 RepID=A0A8K0RA19_9PLEO|nr:hypothetical protein FB567DRAFT_308859 [Paraphoma chrysanthemicola]